MFGRFFKSHSVFYLLHFTLLLHLSVIVRLTNKRIERDSKRVVTAGEISKFFGTLVLMTKYDSENRREYQKTEASKIYGSVANSGRLTS